MVTVQQGLISVLLPVRNWRVTTQRAIRSILEQTHDDLELLLIGQADLQALTLRLRSTGIDDPRIRLLARPSPGIVNALNTGLAHARGEYIARMDDDDVAYAQRLEVQLNYLQTHPDVHLCAGRIRFIDIHDTVIGVASGNRRYATWLNGLTHPVSIANACFAENPMPHPTLFAHHTIWNRLEGYRDVDGPEDHDLVLRAMLMGMRMGKPAPVLLDWREHSQRLTHTDSRYRRKAFVAQSARAWLQLQAAKASTVQPAVWIAGTGKHARHWHDELINNGASVQGFVDMHRPGTQRRKRDLPVISYEHLARIRSDEAIVSAVTQPAGRSAIMEFFNQQGWREGHDFIVGG